MYVREKSVDGVQASAMGMWVNGDTCHPYREWERDKSGKGKIIR